MENTKQSLTILLITSVCLLAGICQVVQGAVLYSTDRSQHGGNSELHSIDTSTGEVTTIGSVGYSVTDLAWDRTRGKLFGVAAAGVTGPTSDGFTGLITINTTTGEGSPVGETRDTEGNIIRVLQIDIDSNGDMYGAPNRQHSYPSPGLLRIDSKTGLAPIWVKLSLQ